MVDIYIYDIFWVRNDIKYPYEREIVFNNMKIRKLFLISETTPVIFNSCNISSIIVRSGCNFIEFRNSKVRKLLILNNIGSLFIENSRIKTLMLCEYLNFIDKSGNKIKDNSRIYTDKKYKNKYLNYLDPAIIEEHWLKRAFRWMM